MKRFSLSVFLFALLLCPFSLRGQSDTSEPLGRMRRAMEAFGGYTATFTIALGEEQLLGSFSVEGERYHIELADVEVYGEAQERYEVNKSRREVTILKTDTESMDILSNPAHALELLGEGPQAVKFKETATELTLTLAVDRSLRRAARLTLDKQSHLPRRIVYLTDGLELTIDIHSLAKLPAPLPPFDKSHYEGYELIDFR